jgi:hypothetical protein
MEWEEDPVVGMGHYKRLFCGQQFAHPFTFVVTSAQFSLVKKFKRPQNGQPDFDVINVLPPPDYGLLFSPK